MTSDDRQLTPPAPAPKIELHVHLEGTVRPATLLTIARRNDLALPADTEAGIAALYEYRDFQRFLDVWVMTTNCLRTGEDFRQVVVEYAAEAASFGAVYLEGIFSPAERAALALTDALTQLPGNPLPDHVIAEAEAELGKEGLAAATWVAITINAWNRVAIAGHEQAGEYEPPAAA